MSIEVGDKVKLKALEFGSALGISVRKRNGGEAKVVKISEDSKGTVYEVELVSLQRKSRSRLCRRSDLIVHHKKTKKRRKKR